MDCGRRISTVSEVLSTRLLFINHFTHVDVVGSFILLQRWDAVRTHSHRIDTLSHNMRNYTTATLVTHMLVLLLTTHIHISHFPRSMTTGIAR